jgi:hypothetical protein
MIAAGHSDGIISIFSTFPHQFVRIMECPTANPLVSLRVVPSRSDLLALRSLPEGSEHVTRITLWTVNGERQKSQEFSFSVKGWMVAGFDEGTKPNVIILRTSDCRLITLSTLSLKCKEELALPTSLSASVLAVQDSQTVLLKTSDECAAFSIVFR